MLRRNLSILLVVIMIVSAFGFGFADVTSTTGDIKLVLLHTNDTHSKILEGSSDGMGFAKLMTQVKAIKAAEPNVLLLDAGDALHGLTFATITQGEPIIKLFNLMGYDAMVAGNHDFDYGQERLVALKDMATFPILAANVYKADKTRLLMPYTIKTIGTVKVGIIGVSTPETAYKTHPKNVLGLTFENPLTETQKVVDAIKDQTDVIVVLSHLGLDPSSTYTSEKLAAGVTDIDVILDGHSHTALETGKLVGTTLIAQTGEYTKNLGRVDLTLNMGKVTTKAASLISKTTAATLVEDPEVKALIDATIAQNKTVTEVVVGNTTVLLDGERANVRVGETNLGNIITNAMLDLTGADVALTNGGGIRTSIQVGDITKGEVITVLPFGNYIMTKKVTGTAILAALENGLSAYPESLGGFPHIAGMKVTFDPSKEKGSRVMTVTVKDKPLIKEAMYVLATNDFMAAGGDNYTMLKDFPIFGEFGTLDEAVVQYMGKVDPASIKVEGRIALYVAPAVPVVPVTPVVTPTPVVYKVVAGDVLWKIAKQFGLDWESLAIYNALKNANLIFPGQMIKIPQ
jgi:5'-nucleotidase